MSRSTTIQLTGDYAGFEFVARIISVGEFRAAQENRSFDESLKFLLGILESWNFADEKGIPLGEPSVRTIAQLPLELPLLMVSAYISKLLAIPGDLRNALMGAAWTGGGAPEELIYSQMCTFYHCLPSQLDAEDADRALLFFQVNNVYEEYRAKHAESKRK